MNRFEPLENKERKRGDDILVIHTKTGQPFWGRIAKVSYHINAKGQVEYGYSIKLLEYEEDEYCKGPNWEVVACL